MTAPPVPLTIRMLGELHVEVHGHPWVAPTSRRACALLGYLALRRVLFHREDGAVRPSLVTTDEAGGHVVVSCLELHVRYEWLLDPLDDGGTSITARCTLPEAEAARWQLHHAAVALSLRRLAELAESATAAPRARG